jgi:type I restriction enzyme S subunit
MLVSNVDKKVGEGEVTVRLCNYVDVYKNERITERLPFMRASATPAEAGRFRLGRGDVLITKDSETWNDIGVPALVEYEAPDLICGYHLAILQPREGILCGGYLLRALQSKGVATQFHVAANGVTRYGLSHEAIKSVLIPVPPMDEQAAIVRFLEYTDRRIRRYIHAKQKLINLLEKQKAAIIHRATTHGLDPNCRLKSSGVEWLGHVPEHWEILPLRRVTITRCDGPFGSGLKSSDYTDDGVRVIRLQNIGHGDFKDAAPAFISKTHYSTLGDHSVETGDILIAGLGDERHPAGRACVAPASAIPAMVKADCFRFRLASSRMNSEFAALHLTATARAASAILSTGATRQRTNLQSTAARRVCVPPLREQVEIVEAIAQNTLQLKAGMDRALGEISLLREYRTRLIADVVTGKLDVREAASRLPAETREESGDSIQEEAESSEPESDLEVVEA